MFVIQLNVFKNVLACFVYKKNDITIKKYKTKYKAESFYQK